MKIFYFFIHCIHIPIIPADFETLDTSSH